MFGYFIEAHRTFDQFSQHDWDRLAGDSPFRRWSWMKAWSQTLGRDHELLLLSVVSDQGEIVGIAPFWVEHSLLRGHVIRFLGSGKACSDYVGIMTMPEHVAGVTDAVAQWFLDESLADGISQPWTMMILEGVLADDVGMQSLVRRVSQSTAVDVSDDESCWVVDLPDTWETYLASLSKRCRRLLRLQDQHLIQSGRAEFKVVQGAEQLTEGLSDLVRLHSQRRETLGCGGCFAVDHFDEFLRSAASGLLQEQRLFLTSVRIDGQVAACGIGCTGTSTIYAYQCGFDPLFAEEKPGWLLNQFQLRYAIDAGYDHFDFLRGDEAYKARLGAQPSAMSRVRIFNNSPAARFRRAAWKFKSNLSTRAQLTH